MYFSGENTLYSRVIAENAMRQEDGAAAINDLTVGLTPVHASGWRLVMAG